MEIIVGKSNINFNNNYLSKVNFNFFSIPKVAINKYFIQSSPVLKKNIYIKVFKLPFSF